MESFLGNTTEALAPVYALVAFAAALFVLGFALWVKRLMHMRTSTLLWTCIFVLVLCALGIVCAVGVVFVSAPSWLGACILIAFAGILVSLREKATSFLQARVLPYGSLRSALALCLAAPLSFIALEASCNPDITKVWTNAAVLEVALILLLYGALFFLAQRHSGLAALGMGALLALGIAQNFVDRFKAAALLPSDLFAARTAAAVAGGYSFTLDTHILWALAAASWALCALSYASADCGQQEAHTPRSTSRTLRRTGLNLACSAVFAFGLIVATVPQDYQSLFNYQLYYWDLRLSYQKLGFLNGFIAAAQDLPVQIPQDYSAERAQNSIAQHAAQYTKAHASDTEKQTLNNQFAEVQPHVVVIMCESYSDLSLFDQLHCGYEGTWLTRNMHNSVLRGTVHTSVHGGGTCNSEFEFLSGFSMGFLGRGAYPFLQYSFSGLETCATTFNRLGYDTTFMHPASAGNWNRDIVYPALGFDREMFYADFAGSKRFHHYTSDEATYAKIVDTLQRHDKPQFVFDVTLQNHTGYGLESIPLAQRTHFQPSDEQSASKLDELNEYLSCVAESDRALQSFLDSLEKLNEPVVVVFFGDHQPALSRSYNDAYFTEEDALVHNARIMQTPYVIWANYQLAGHAQDGSATQDLSLNYLGAVMLECIGAPLNDYQKAQLDLMQSMPIVSTNGICGADGKWKALNTDHSTTPECNNLACMQYYRFETELR